MTRDEARTHVLAAIETTAPALHEPRVYRQLAVVAADIPLGELELDSLGAMELCLAIEERTGVEIDLGDLAIHRSVNAVAELLARRSGG